PAQAQQPQKVWPDDGGVSPFYTWTGKLPAKPGQMLRTEPMTDKTAPLTNAASSTRILYTSTDGIAGKGQTAVSGELYIPKGTAPKGGWPLMAWAHGTVGIADKCAPSFAGRSQRDIDYLNFWLDQGYAVVASDYQGLGTPGRHPYLATRPAAYSVLDSVRAVQNGKFGLSKKVVLIGQSQGGGAAWATAAYAKAYAPELDIRGTVATGTPYFSAAAQKAVLDAKPRDAVDPTFAYTMLILTMHEMQDPNFKITDYVSDKAMPTMKVGMSECLGPLERGVMDNKLSYNATFKKDAMDEIVKAYALMGYPNLKPSAPIFMGTGGKDRDVVPGMQESLVRDACKAGAVIEWHLYPDLDHSGTVNGSRQDSAPFVKKAFSGEKITGNCKT
ncbi:MAG TPA: lipase family protein, partial [Caulobacteraceae bacterium]|nr:lipase family protein [Caulobacteraceae bacterium]